MPDIDRSDPDDERDITTILPAHGWSSMPPWAQDLLDAFCRQRSQVTRQQRNLALTQILYLGEL